MTKEIWVNTRFLSQQISGVQKFAIELCRELKAINPNIKFVAPSNVIHQEIANELNVVITGNRTGQQWEQIDLPKFLNKKNSPLLLNLCNSAPISYSNSIVTIHDLAFLENPKWFSPTFRIWYKYLIPRILKKAKHVFTVSEFSKNELEKRLSTPTENISVIYNGIASDLIQYKIGHPNSGSRKKTILSVGSINPRKNIKPLIEAFNSLNLEEYELLIVGATNSNFGKEKFEIDNKNIKLLGYVSDEELWKLYKSSALFVYPSLYEGFGIPILEALYFGCPVLTTNLEVYKEVYGKFEINYSDGNSSKDYMIAIKNALDNNLSEQNLPEEILSKCSYPESAKKINAIITKLSHS
jgi:glycosyltransferase involved in cell wall biosynthesis